MVRSAIGRRSSNKRRREVWEFSHREQHEATKVHRGDAITRRVWPFVVKACEAAAVAAFGRRGEWPVETVRSAIGRRSGNERRREAWEFSHREQHEATKVHRGDASTRRVRPFVVKAREAAAVAAVRPPRWVAGSSLQPLWP